jgi:hypothetical protein
MRPLPARAHYPLGLFFVPPPRPQHAPLPPLRRHTPPAKLHSHDATQHCTRTACVLCSHCLVCCRRVICALVGSGISLSSAPLLAGGLDSLASSAVVREMQRLVRNRGTATASTSTINNLEPRKGARALVDKNIIIIFVYFPRRRHRTFCVCARACVLSTLATRQRHATP